MIAYNLENMFIHSLIYTLIHMWERRIIFIFFYKKMALVRKKYINQNKLIIIKNENFSFIFFVQTNI